MIESSAVSQTTQSKILSVATNNLSTYFRQLKSNRWHIETFSLIREVAQEGTEGKETKSADHSEGK